ncbi:MAG: hypothetical protein EOS21_05755 [Mesorhizobium sp.]|nr:MAG: hypothetical protein EOS21_05755 [Mesorhizobium sp.]
MMPANGRSLSVADEQLIATRRARVWQGLANLAHVVDMELEEFTEGLAKSAVSWRTLVCT